MPNIKALALHAREMIRRDSLDKDPIGTEVSANSLRVRSLQLLPNPADG
jgi:hypothetical protein